jgi:hypothetical protein
LLGLPRLLSERFTFGPCRSQRPIGGDDDTGAILRPRMRLGKLGATAVPNSVERADSRSPPPLK